MYFCISDYLLKYDEEYYGHEVATKIRTENANSG